MLPDNSMETPPKTEPPRERLDRVNFPDRLDFEDRWQASHRRHWVFDIILALLVVGLAGLAWYLFPVIQSTSAEVSRVPDVQKQVGALEDGLKSTGSKLDQWTAGEQALKDRSDRALRDLRSRIDAFEARTSENTSTLMARMESEFLPPLQRLQAEYADLEGAHASDRERVAALEREVQGLREQNETLAQNLAHDVSVMQQRMEEQAAAAQQQATEVTELRQVQQRNRSDFDTLNESLATDRVDFQVMKSRRSEIAPGVMLNITGIDVSRQRISGWISVSPDHRDIQFRGQSADQPVDFYTADNKKHELVVTNLTGGSVAGYLLQPRAAGIAAISPAAD